MAEQTYQDFRSERLNAPASADAAPEAPASDTPADTSAVEIPDTPVDEDVPEKRPKRRDRNEQRYRRLSDRARRVERENAELRGELTAIKDMLQTGRVGPASTPPDTGRPTRDQYPDDDDYMEAMIDWKTDQRNKTAPDPPPQEASTAPAADLQESRTDFEEAHADFVDAGRERYDDFDAVVDKSTVQFSGLALMAFHEHESGPDVAYYLMQHPDEAAPLLDMGPLAFGRAYQAIEAKVQQSSLPADETPPAQPPTAPLQPLTPVEPGGTAPEPEPSTMNYRDFRAARLKGRL